MKNNSFLKFSFFSRIMPLLCLLTLGSPLLAQWTDPVTGVTFTPISGTSFGTGTEGADKACDGNAGTKLGTGTFSAASPAYVVVRASSAVKISGYSITTGNDNASNNNRNPKNWKVYGSNDNSSWTPIATVTNDAILEDINNKTYYYTCTSSQSYTYFKYEVSATRGAGFMQFSEFHPLAILPSSSTNVGYVMFSSSNYLTTSTSGTTTFSPSTCLWTGTSGSSFKNGDYYIYLSNDAVLNTSSRNITLGGTESGATGCTVYRNGGGGGTTYYLRFNGSSWERTNSGTATGRNVAFAVTKHTYNESATNPAFSGADQFSDSEIGSTKNYTITTDASYRPGLINYVFYNNTDHFFKSDNSTSLTTPLAAEGITYTWELSSNASGHVSVTSSGAVTYDNTFEEDTYVTLTLKATSNTSNHVFTSATKTILFEAPSVNPTDVTASNLTVYVGQPRPASVTLEPNPCYRRLEYTSSNTGIATVSNAGVVTGVAVGTTTVNVKAYKIGNTEYLSTTFNVTVKDKVATPVISYVPTDSDNGATATITLTCATPGATIYYTTNGDEPTTSSTPYTATFSVNNNQTVKAIAVKDVTGWDNSDIATLTYVTRVLPTPTIEINNGSMTFTCSEPGVTFHYTTNGDTPTASSTAWTGPTPITGLTNECTIKVLATKTGWVKSAVASRQYIQASGVSGTVVTLNDYEDHNWSYYQPNGGVDEDYGYPDRLCSPYPRNVKITYYGNGKVYKSNNANPSGEMVDASGVAVSRYETANTFVYYKTLERNANDRFPYELIPNPFSKRPTYGTDGTNKWRGFYGWRIKSITNGKVYDNGTERSVGYIFTTEYQQLDFQPNDNAKTNANNATSMEVEFEAVWARAYRVTCTAADITGTSGVSSTTLQTGVSYERNFVVVTEGTSTTNLSDANQRPVTITMIEPDGSTDYRTADRYYNPAYLIARNSLKIEWMNLRVTNTIGGNGQNVVLGRGIMYGGASHTASNGEYGTVSTNVNNTNTTNYTGVYINGLGYNTSTTTATISRNCDYKLRIESGVYRDVGILSTTNGSNSNMGGSYTVHAYAIVGNDYDRALQNGKTLSGTRMLIYDHLCEGVTNGFDDNNHANAHRESMNLVMKSGYIGLRYDSQISAGTYIANLLETVYVGVSSSVRTSGYRRFRFEGGNVAGITGGIDRWTKTGSSTSRADNYDEPMMRIRIVGQPDYPIVRGPAFGGAANTQTFGYRQIVMTGGIVKGWLAGGCNGTSAASGVNWGPSYIYVGGNGQVNSGGNNNNFNTSQGGNVFGAGSGTTQNMNTGRMEYGTHVVIADNAYVERNVYGGGNLGYTEDAAKLFITGGTVSGKVFGGANQRQGGTVDIVMTDGTIEGGIYGGSNVTGTINSDVNIQINGGQIGTSSTPANVHGGGYGNATRVIGSVNVMVGESGATDGATIYGDIYGGSAEGKTNGDNAQTPNAVTNVTLNAGTIYGSLYGGGLGNTTNNYAADVWGPVTVTVNGGKICSTSSDGSGAVFGCNNANGRPQGKVNVNVTGGEMEYIYGGGNAAPYTVSPSNSFDNFHVSMSGGTVHKHVFGGGLGANAVITGNTEVRISGSATVEGNVYGGGNAGTVTGNTNVQIGTN